MTGDGRATQTLVLGAIGVLILTLCGVVIVSVDRNRTTLLEAVGITPVPPDDPGQARARVSGNPAQFFSADSYPEDARAAGAEGLVVAELTVEPNGRVGACAVVKTSGHASLDQRTCDIARAHIRYRPARDEQGRAIAATTVLPVRWVLPAD